MNRGNCRPEHKRKGSLWGEKKPKFSDKEAAMKGEKEAAGVRKLCSVRKDV